MIADLDTSSGTSSAVPSRGLISTLLVGALGVGGLVLCYRLVAPFLTPLALAFVLAVLFLPFHLSVERHIQPRSLAAFVSMLAIAGAVFAVLTLLIAQMVREAAIGADLVRAALEDGLLQKLLVAYPNVASTLQTIFERINASALAADTASWFTNIGTSFLRGSVVQIAGALLTFFLLFYFLRDRHKVLAVLRSFFPFTEAETALLFRRTVDTIHATVYGVVVTGVLLGLLGGIIFAAVGLPAPFFWGLVIGAFAILPVFGTGMVWIPAALFLALDGEWGRAVIIIIAFGALTAADTIAYPYLVGNRMKLHTAVTFVAAVGGLIVFGPIGFILGPLVVALTVALKEIIWARIPQVPAPSA